MRTRLFKLATWLLIAVMPSSMLMAEAAQAVVNSTGTVTVDNRAVSQGQAVFSGEMIQTSGDSTAVLNFQGSTVYFSPNTSVILGTDELTLGCGDVVVTTAKEFAVKVGDVLVKPAQGGSAKFEVTQSSSGARISAQQGALSLSNGKMVEPGQTEWLPGNGTCGPPAGTTRRSVPPAAGTNMGEAVLIGAAAAGGAAALVILTTRHPTSPK